MNFTSPAFVLAFPLILALHWALPPRARWVLLLAASAAFYAIGSVRALPLLAAVTLGTYAAARRIARADRPGIKKFWLAAASVLCLGCLGVFKYADLAVGTAAALLGGQAAALGLLLPAGISFYTFQTMSYVIDVFRGDIAAERHLGHYALFVCFFPQLVAGPIERSGALLPQLKNGVRTADRDGWLILLRGFAKKLLLADAMSPFVDAVYAAPAAADGPAAVLATVLFAGQIFFDFSGYSDIAVGSAALLGVRLSKNFDRPYSAASLREFWRRWHISLTRWFTDYLYIPLGGSRCGAVRRTGNLMLVFLVSGLWHGAAWHYAVWGGIHGLLLAAQTAARRAGLRPRLPVWVRRCVTLALVCAAWVFFRAESVGDALTLFAALGRGWTPDALRRTLLRLGAAPAAQLLLALAALRLLPAERRALNPPALAGCFLLALAAGAAWFTALGSGTASAFLYFQF